MVICYVCKTRSQVKNGLSIGLCHKCGRPVCDNETCFKWEVNVGYGYCRPCFNNMDLETYTPTIKEPYVYIEAIDSPIHKRVFKKVTPTAWDTLTYITTTLNKLDYHHSDNQELLEFVRRLKMFLSVEQFKEIDIYFGFMDDKYSYYVDKNMRDTIDSIWMDTIYVVAKDKSIIEEIYKIYDFDWTDKDGMINTYTDEVYSPTQQISIPDELDIVDDLLDGRHVLRMWFD